MAEHDTKWQADLEPEEDSERQLAEWEEQSYKDQILFVIDGHESMYKINERTGLPFIHQAFESVFKVYNSKLISSPSDKIGVVVIGTGVTKSPTPKDPKKAGRTWDGHYVYLDVDQVSVEARQQLKKDIVESRADPEYYHKLFGKRDRSSFTVAIALSLIQFIFKQSGKAGTKRAFWITNEDDPHKSEKSRHHANALEAIKNCKKIGIEFEPYLMGKEGKPFVINNFYAELFDQYDDEIPDINREMRGERQMRTRKPWEWEVYEEDLASEMIHRETPKRTTFCVDFEIAPNLIIGVKGYSTIMPARKGDAVWFYEDEDGAVQEAWSKPKYEDANTGRQLAAKDRYKAFQFQQGSTAKANAKAEDDDAEVSVPKTRNVELSTDEVNEAKTMGMSPSMRLIGTMPRSWLKPWHNIAHATFIHPAEQNWTGSRAAFGAFHAALLKKNKIALALLCPRKNTAPYFVALLPQEEVFDEQEDKQIVAPGMHCIRLPFADDLRDCPVTTEQLSANHTEVDAAKEIIRKLTRKWPYAPEEYPNPTLAMHYTVLQRAAYDEGPDEIPDPRDETKPKYELQRKHAGAAIEKLNEAIEDDQRSQASISKGKGSAVPDNIDEAHVKSLWIKSELHKLLAKDLQELCSRMRLTGVVKRKPDMIIAVHNTLMELYPDDVKKHRIVKRAVNVAD